MKFHKDDKLTRKLFLEACKEVDEKYKNNLNEDVHMPSSFSTIEEAEKYFRSVGGITVEEFEQKKREKYGI